VPSKGPILSGHLDIFLFKKKRRNFPGKHHKRFSEDLPTDLYKVKEEEVTKNEF